MVVKSKCLLFSHLRGGGGGGGGVSVLPIVMDVSLEIIIAPPPQEKSDPCSITPPKNIGNI
jgi:hypothetical protein